MKDLSELKSFLTLRKAAEILGVSLPVVWSPTEENYMVGKHGGIGIGVSLECRARLYLAEIGRDREWSLEDTVDRMIGNMPERSRLVALEQYAEWRDEQDHKGD